MPNIIVDGLVDTSRAPSRSRAAIKIGGRTPRYGGINPLGSCRHILVSNVVTRAHYGVFIGGSPTDSMISNILHTGEDGVAICYESGMKNIRDVMVATTHP